MSPPARNLEVWFVQHWSGLKATTAIVDSGCMHPLLCWTSPVGCLTKDRDNRKLSRGQWKQRYNVARWKGDGTAQSNQ